MKKMLLALVTFLSFSLSAMAGVNINNATQAELESLNGIGPVKAQAIIDYRKKNGDFKSVDELEKVNGVGPVTLQNVRKDVSISGATTAVTKSSNKKTDSAKETKPVNEIENATPTATAKVTTVTEVKTDKPAKNDEKATITTDKEAAKKAKADAKAAKDAEKEAAKKAKTDAKAAKKAEKDAAKTEKTKTDKK